MLHVSMIMVDYRYTTSFIGRILGIIDDSYSEAVTGLEMDSMDDEKIKNVVMTHNFSWGLTQKIFVLSRL